MPGLKRLECLDLGELAGAYLALEPLDALASATRKPEPGPPLRPRF
jgi:hypothetical protein